MQRDLKWTLPLISVWYRLWFCMDNMSSALRRPDQVGVPLSNGHFVTVHQHNKVLMNTSDKDRPKATYNEKDYNIQMTKQTC